MQNNQKRYLTLIVTAGVLSLCVLLVANVSGEQVPTALTGRVIRATAKIRDEGSGQMLEFKSNGGDFGRIKVSPNRSLAVLLELENVIPDEPVHLRAHWGGSLNRQEHGLKFTPSARQATFDFQFTTANQNGPYPVEIVQGTRRVLLDFWVGPDEPLGEPGPDRDFGPDKAPDSQQTSAK